MINNIQRMLMNFLIIVTNYHIYVIVYKLLNINEIHPFFLKKVKD